MIDPEVSLAFSVYSNPGVYALLLGSGLSRSAEIPTGWDIVRDLIRKIAVLKEADPGERPEEWYKTTFGVDPDYSNLLDELAKTPEERSQSLRHYFEPNEEERQRGVKTPTPAHRAIADLVKAGYIRVIITTNFDRLQESALADVGIQPQVISTPDAVKGALPLSHSKCLIVKINGDYLDSRIKNTRVELETYDPSLDALLDRIFDEFGLIVCGWSGDWDLALYGSIERCPSRRFSMYWIARGEPTTRAADLINFRGCVPVKVDSADSFFTILRGKVLALRDLGETHPLSARIASIQAKRYIVNPDSRILLHDLVVRETEFACAKMDPAVFHASSVSDFAGETAKRLRLYEGIVETLLPIQIIGCYWGRTNQMYLSRLMLKRLGDLPLSSGGLVAWTALRLYPATLVFYVGGIAAIAARTFQNLLALYNTPIKLPFEQDEKAAAICFNQAHVFKDGLHKLLPGMANRHTPLSDYLFESLREYFRETLSVDGDYETAFFLFEYLQSIFYWHLQPGWAPIGRARWQLSSMYTPDGPTGTSQPVIAEAANVLFPKGIPEYVAVKAMYDLWALKNTPGW